MQESYLFEKNLRALFFPLESFDFIGTQSAIRCIKENIHFFVSFLSVMNFPWFYANKQTAPCMSRGGISWVDVAEKIIQNDYKIVTTKEGLETTNNDLTFIRCCEFQREGFARDWLRLGLFQLEIISCRNFFFSLQSGKTASWISQRFNSLVHRADICLCRSIFSQ